MYSAADMVNLMRKCTENTIGDSKTSNIVYGTVTEINPLRVQLEGIEKPYHESFFILSPFVKVREERLRIRSVKGVLGAGGDSVNVRAMSDLIASSLAANSINHGLSANSINKSFGASSLNKSISGNTIDTNVGAAEGVWSAGGSDEVISGSGEGYSRIESLDSASISFNVDDASGQKSLQDASLSTNIQNSSQGMTIQDASFDLSINHNGTVNIDINEQPFEDETHRDHHRHTDMTTNEEIFGMKETEITWTDTDEMNTAFYDQTFVIDVISGRGLKVGDKVWCTSHNNNQRFVIWEVLNRLV